MAEMKLLAVGSALAIIFTSALFASEHRDQRNHWQLMLIEIDLSQMKVVNAVEANKVDYSHDACVALTDLVHAQSPNGQFEMALGCQPKDLIDTKAPK